MIQPEIALAPAQVPFVDITETNQLPKRIKRRKHDHDLDAVVPCQYSIGGLPEIKENTV